MSAERGGQKPRAEITVIKAATEQELIAWNKTVGKYELTAVGHKHLEERRHKIATGVWCR